MAGTRTKRLRPTFDGGKMGPPPARQVSEGSHLQRPFCLKSCRKLPFRIRPLGADASAPIQVVQRNPLGARKPTLMQACPGTWVGSGYGVHGMTSALQTCAVPTSVQGAEPDLKRWTRNSRRTLTRAARGPPPGVSKLRVMIGALQSSRTVVSRPLRTASQARKSGCSATPAPASRA